MALHPDPTASLDAQAAHWLVQLSGDDAAQREEAARLFETWKAADPRHAAAATAMERLLGHVQDVRQTGGGAGRAAVTAALGHARAGRGRRLGATLALACVLAVPGWMAWQAYPPSYLLADVRASTGQWKTEVLPDGTRITLNSGSAVNLRYDASRRALELLRGEVFIDVSKDPHRPFVVETPDGSMRAVGTRFVVNRSADSTLLTVIESRVAVQAARRPSAQWVIEAGQAVRLRPDGLGPIITVEPGRIEDAWHTHRLFADDRPLNEVLDTLARHRPGVMRFDAAALSQVRVSAVLPLDDTDRALQLLAASLPGLRVRSYTPYFLSVDLDPAQAASHQK